jgi:hypothetical protein
MHQFFMHLVMQLAAISADEWPIRAMTIGSLPSKVDAIHVIGPFSFAASDAAS